MSSQSRGTGQMRLPGTGLRRGRMARPTRIGLAGVLVALATWGCTTGSSTSSPAVGATLRPRGVTATSAGVSPTGSKAPGGAFSATGPMASARIADTATRLSDGRVLIVGGGTGSTDMIIDGAFATAELYDPASGEFSATGSMLTARGDHTATLLTDGRVLVTGGTSSLGGNLAQAELYDPATGKFSATGSMITVRSRATATLLSDGRVLIAGGFHPQWRPEIASAELYDPATGKFSATGSLGTARYDHTASLLADGRVLVAGGASEVAGGTSESAELYDPKTGKFSPAGPTTAARSGATATTLSDGRVLIAGGENGPGFLASAEVYDPVTGKFAATGSMKTARTAQAAALLSDGRVFIVGGWGGWDGSKWLYHSSAETYDPKTGTFSPAGSMAIGRSLPTATLLSDGRVLITGGLGPDDFGPLASAELYQP